MLDRLLREAATRLEHLLEFRTRLSLGGFSLDQETADRSTGMVFALQLGRIVTGLTVASLRGFASSAFAPTGA